MAFYIILTIRYHLACLATQKPVRTSKSDLNRRKIVISAIFLLSIVLEEVRLRKIRGGALQQDYTKAEDIGL